jgi:hypothetical protein
MIPLHHDPHDTFRFAEDRIIPRFRPEGVGAGRRVDVFRKVRKEIREESEREILRLREAQKEHLASKEKEVAHVRLLTGGARGG